MLSDERTTSAEKRTREAKRKAPPELYQVVIECRDEGNQNQDASVLREKGQYERNANGWCEEDGKLWRQGKRKIYGAATEDTEERDAEHQAGEGERAGHELIVCV